MQEVSAEEQCKFVEDFYDFFIARFIHSEGQNEAQSCQDSELDHGDLDGQCIAQAKYSYHKDSSL